MLLQKLCIVLMWAFDSKTCCLFSLLSNGRWRISSDNLSDILSFISAAAALVNVTIRSLSASHGFSSSTNISITLCTSTAVFPEPAAADTRMLPFLAFIASSCGFVHFLFSKSSPSFHLAQGLSSKSSITSSLDFFSTCFPDSSSVKLHISL